MMQTTFWCRSETESVNITGIHFLKYSELYVLNVGGGGGHQSFFSLNLSIFHYCTKQLWVVVFTTGNEIQ